MNSLYTLLYEELKEHLDADLNGTPIYVSKHDISRLTVHQTAELNELFYNNLASQYDSSVALEFNISFHVSSNEIEVDENRVESLVADYQDEDY